MFVRDDAGEIGDVGAPAERRLARRVRLPAAALVVEQDGAAGGQEVELRPQVVLRRSGAAVQREDLGPVRTDPAREQRDAVISPGDDAGALRVAVLYRRGQLLGRTPPRIAVTLVSRPARLKRTCTVSPA